MGIAASVDSAYPRGLQTLTDTEPRQTPIMTLSYPDGSDGGWKLHPAAPRLLRSHISNPGMDRGVWNHLHSGLQSCCLEVLGDPLSPSCCSELPRAPRGFLGLNPAPDLLFGFINKLYSNAVPCGSSRCRDSPGSRTNARPCPGGTEGRGVQEEPPRPSLRAAGTARKSGGCEDSGAEEAAGAARPGGGRFEPAPGGLSSGR